MEGPVLTSDICVFLTFYFIACKANELVTCSSSRACLSLRERLAITTDRLSNANKWRVHKPSCERKLIPNVKRNT